MQPASFAWDHLQPAVKAPAPFSGVHGLDRNSPGTLTLHGQAYSRLGPYPNCPLTVGWGPIPTVCLHRLGPYPNCPLTQAGALSQLSAYTGWGPIPTVGLHRLGPYPNCPLNPNGLGSCVLSCCPLKSHPNMGLLSPGIMSPQDKQGRWHAAL